MKQLQSLRSNVCVQRGYAGHVALRPAQALNKPCFNRVQAGLEDKRNCCSCCLRRKSGCGASGRRQYRNLMPNKISRQRRQSVRLAIGPTKFDCYIAALVKARRAEALAECRQTRPNRSGVSLPRYPMTGIAGCCACATSGQTAAPPKADELASPHVVDPEAKDTHRIGLGNQLPEGGHVRFGSEADMCSAKGMSALPPIADMCGAQADVRFVPTTDMTTSPRDFLGSAAPASRILAAHSARG